VNSNISEIPINNTDIYQPVSQVTPLKITEDNSNQTIVDYDINLNIQNTTDETDRISYKSKPDVLNSPSIFQSNNPTDCSVIGFGSKFYLIGKINTFEIHTQADQNLLVQFSGCNISFEGYISKIESGIYLVEYFPTRSSGPYQVEILSHNLLLLSFTINPKIQFPNSQQ